MASHAAFCPTILESKVHDGGAHCVPGLKSSGKPSIVAELSYLLYCTSAFLPDC